MATSLPNKTELFILNEVDSVPDKIVGPDIVRRATGLTIVGFRRVLDRLIDRNWLGWTDDRRVTLTFGGMQAMRASGLEVQ